MESKKIKQAMNRYLQDILDFYHREDRSGITAYCQLLKGLLYSTLQFLPGNFTRENVEIEILELPVKLKIHMPCMRIWDGKTRVYGYIDVLRPGTSKKEIDIYPLKDLYKRVFPNLLLTNFFEFRYYREEQKVCTARPFKVSNISEITDQSKATLPKVFLKELQHYMLYSDKKSKETSFINLQKRLALKTYYLKEYILTPLIEHLLESRAKCELARLYRAYCYFFDLELSLREFSAFLAHVIIDGFIRAGIFYSNMKSNPYTPFSRGRVFEFARLNQMPERRLALFKYVSQETVDDRLFEAVKRFLDDICEILDNFDFNRMGFPCKNPGLIDGAMLQWEDYFFSPYYDTPDEKKRVKELLIKAGIFPGENRILKQKK